MTTRLVLGLAVLCGTLAPGAAAQRFEVGASIGYNEPVDQGDASDDVCAGVYGRIPLGDRFKIEPSVSWYDLDNEPYRVRNVPQEVSTWGIWALSANLTYGAGFGRSGMHPYVTAGGGLYLLRKDEAPDQDRPGLNAGFGVVVGVRPDVSIDLSANGAQIFLDQGGARTLASLKAGIVYHFGMP